MIKLQEISKSYDGGATFAVRQISFQVEDGETVILLGSSGCGKTTTLKMINRLIEPTDGEIQIDGTNVLRQDPVELRRSVGYVFQGIGLFPHMTVGENVQIIPKLLGTPRTERERRARELIETVGLDPDAYFDRYPDELSGGQQQRVGVARALSADPSHLLMDEPFGALDAVTRDTLQQELLKLKQRLGKTIIFVTHDVFEAMTLGDRIAVLHDGKLEQIAATKDLVLNPATDFVRELVEKPTQQLTTFRELMS